MTDHVATFAEARARLVGIAYRMLGTPDDAEDVVQDAWLRWDAADRSTIREPVAWLTTVTTRLAIDRLRSARARREVYVGPWLPEPLPTTGSTAPDPADEVTAAETLTVGFLTVLERLEPVERAAFLLHDVFGLPFAEVAEAIDRKPDAARQLASRARTRVREASPRARTPPPPERAEALADAFLGAIILGDVDALRAMLTDDVVHLSDGGPHRRAARRPVVGSDRVARLLLSLASRVAPGTELVPVSVNGQPGWFASLDGVPEMVLVPSFDGERVCAIHAVLNPDKLAGFAAALGR